MKQDASSFPLCAERVEYWLRGEDVQNFGDFLSEYIFQKALLFPYMEARVYRLLGSCIASSFIQDDLEKSEALPYEKIAFWGCGLRGQDMVPSAELLDRCLFYGARGPLTRDALGLPSETALGDPGFITPLLYQPTKCLGDSKPLLCVPHIHEPKNDTEISTITGAEKVLRPAIPSSLAAVEALIDEITNARFVLTGSLHAAVIACAYDVPFAFMDIGWIDVPFKWDDLASSLGVEAVFVNNIADGIRAYSMLYAPTIKKPKLAPILKQCPFYVRPLIMYKALLADIESGNIVNEYDDVCQLLDNNNVLTNDSNAGLEQAMRSLQARISAAKSGATKLDAGKSATSRTHIYDLWKELTATEAEYKAIINSTLWRVTAPLREAGDKLPPPVRSLIRQSVKVAHWAATSHNLPARIRSLRQRWARDVANDQGQ